MIVGFVYALIPGALQLIATTLSPEFLKTFIKDDFAIACIDHSVVWGGYEFLIGILLGIILLVSVIYWHGTKQITSILVSTVLYLFLLMVLIVPKIEKYSQGPAIAFISQFKDKPVWVSTLGYYSYAPYFYSAKMQRACTECNEEEFLLKGPVNKEVYFVTKVTAFQSVIDKYPQLDIVEKRGGFVLLKRNDKK